MEPCSSSSSSREILSCRLLLARQGFPHTEMSHKEQVFHWEVALSVPPCTTSEQLGITAWEWLVTQLLTLPFTTYEMEMDTGFVLFLKKGFSTV